MKEKLILFAFLTIFSLITTPIIKNNLFSILYVSCKIPHTFLLFINRSFGFLILIFKLVKLVNFGNKFLNLDTF